MPKVFLSPSLQDQNQYITGNGSEKFFMNLLCDAIIPYYILNGITFERSSNGDSLTGAIQKSNQFQPDLHIAIHSNAAPESMTGDLIGPEVYYYKDSKKGSQAAQDFGRALSEIYPYEETAEIIPVKDELAELRLTKAPAVFIEVAYHDNEQDAIWIENNIREIAQAIAKGTSQYFGLPFYGLENAGIGLVNIKKGTLNIRSAPNTKAKVISSLPSNATVVITRTFPEWYFILSEYGAGYVSKDYITVL